MERICTLALLLGPLVAGACGGTRGALDAGVYRDGPVAFRLAELPPAWRRIDISDAVLAYRDEPNEASILINARCKPLDVDAPLRALTNHLLIGTTERAVDLEETIPFDAREALHTRLAAKLDGVPMRYDLYVLKKDGCVYDFVYVAPPERFAAGTAAFERLVTSFHTLPGAGAS